MSVGNAGASRSSVRAADRSSVRQRRRRMTVRLVSVFAALALMAQPSVAWAEASDQQIAENPAATAEKDAAGAAEQPSSESDTSDSGAQTGENASTDDERTDDASQGDAGEGEKADSDEQSSSEALGEEEVEEELPGSARPPIVARAAPNNNYCSVPGVYGLVNENGYFVNSFALNGQGTDARTGSINSGGTEALAIRTDGSYAYVASSTGNGFNIYRLSASANDGEGLPWVSHGDAGQPSAGAMKSVGGVDYYYFGYYVREGSTTYFDLLAYNTGTSSLIGRVARIPMPAAADAATAHADIAFDSSGALILLWSNAAGTKSVVARLASVPTAVDTPVPTATLLSEPATVAGYPWSGLAYDDAGAPWVLRAGETVNAFPRSYLAQLNPTTGAISGEVAKLGAQNQLFSGLDLASCYSGSTAEAPTSMTLNKNVASRHNGGDQFKLDIRLSGGGTDLVAETTSGSTLGPQSQTTPIDVAPGSVYTIAETGSNGADLTDYTIAYACTWASNSAAFASGTLSPSSNRAQVALPQIPNDRAGDTLNCTITNTAINAPTQNLGLCSVPGTYTLDANRNLRPFPTSGSTSSTVGTFNTLGSLKGSINGLAITSDGSAAYAAGYRENWTGTQDRYEILKLNADGTGGGSVIQSGNLNSVANDDAVMVGAIDPTNTYYYFGHFSRSGGTTRLELWAANIKIPEWIGQVGRVTLTGAGSVGLEGDIAFDQNGAMLILWGSGTAAASRLYRVDTPPTTAGTGTITPTQLASNITSTNTRPWNGIAFDSAGNLWIQRQDANNTSRSYRQQINPADGAFIGTGAEITTDFVGNDLASCGLRWMLSLKKDIVSRVDSGDQFKLDIRDSGDAVLATATTVGSGVGVQAVTAGPISVNNNMGVKITETGANGANLAGYTSTYGCTWQTNGDNLVTPGTPLTYSFLTGRAEIALPTLPTNRLNDTLVCTITNTAKTAEERSPKISVSKALNGNRINNGHQFTMMVLRQGDSTPLVSATTSGSGSTVSGGVATLNSTVEGAGYIIGEAGAGTPTANLANYAKTYVCTWSDGTVFDQGSLNVGSNGRAQATLPLFSPNDRVAQTLSCVITNKAVTSSTPVCTTGYTYAVGAGGQMLQVNPSGVVSNIGSSAGVDLNSLGIGPGGTTTYAVYRDSSNAYQGRVYSYNTATGVWSRISSGTGWDMTIGNGAIVAGAVSPITGTYYAGGFTESSPTGDFILKSLNAAGTGMVDNGYIDLDSYDNGDILFDGQGNMYLVRGKNSADFRRTAVFRVAAADLAAAAGTTNAIPFTTVMAETILTGMASGAAVNGAGYDANGRLVMSTASALYSLALPGTTTTTISLSGVSFSGMTDLATCTYPPTVSLRKELPNGRVAPADRFGLTLYRDGTVSNAGTNNASISGGTSLGTATAQSPASGLQLQTVSQVVVAQGQTISFAETFTNGASGSNYVSGYTCTVDDQPMSPTVTGNGSAGQFTVPTFTTSSDIICTFTNSPHATVTVKKTLLDANGLNPTPGQNWTMTTSLATGSTSGTAVSAPAARQTAADGSVATPWRVTFPNLAATANVTIAETVQPGYAWVSGTCTITPASGGAATTVAMTGISVTLQGSGPSNRAVRPGDLVECEFVNQVQTGSASWQKVDAANPSTHLAGSSWSLSGPGVPANTVVVDCVVALPATCPSGAYTDQDPRAGYFSVTGLAIGSYTLTEYQAPAGFSLITTPHSFTISAGTLNYVGPAFQNSRLQMPAIPLTGGSASDLFLIGGGGLLALALIGAWLYRRRQRRLLPT